MFDHNSTILAFHQTSDRFYPGINNIKPKRFFCFLELLKNWEYSFWGGKRHNEESGPSRDIVLTFDDGYEDQYDLLARLCHEGIKPIVFIPTAFIGKKNRWEYSSRFFPALHLSRNQIGGLADIGVIFGSHGLSHQTLVGMSDDPLQEELSASKYTLEETTGRPVDFLSFPFGRTDQRITEAARNCGYRKGFVMDLLPPVSDSCDFILSRIPIYGIDDYYSIKSKLLKPGKLEMVKNRIINGLSSGTIIASGTLK